MIAMIHGHKTNAKFSYVEAPVDLMYGFRGNQHNVDLVSPFEMWRFWRIEKVLPPSSGYECSTYTDEGLALLKECKKARRDPEWKPGIHYVVRLGEGRVTLQLTPAIGDLPHRHFWVKPGVQVVPVFGFAEVLHSRLSPEEICRLLSVYMRP